MEAGAPAEFKFERVVLRVEDDTVFAEFDGVPYVGRIRTSAIPIVKVENIQSVVSMGADAVLISFMIRDELGEQTAKVKLTRESINTGTLVKVFDKPFELSDLCAFAIKYGLVENKAAFDAYVRTDLLCDDPERDALLIDRSGTDAKSPYCACTNKMPDSWYSHCHYRGNTVSDIEFVRSRQCVPRYTKDGHPFTGHYHVTNGDIDSKRETAIRQRSATNQNLLGDVLGNTVHGWNYNTLVGSYWQYIGFRNMGACGADCAGPILAARTQIDTIRFQRLIKYDGKASMYINEWTPYGLGIMVTQTWDDHFSCNNVYACYIYCSKTVKK